MCFQGQQPDCGEIVSLQLESLLKFTLLGPAPRVLIQQGWVRAQEWAFLTIPDGDDDAYLRTTLWEQLSEHYETLDGGAYDLLTLASQRLKHSPWRVAVFTTGGHGNPLQCSCMENPMDRGAPVHWVAVSQTQMKQVSTYATIFILPF